MKFDSINYLCRIQETKPNLGIEFDYRHGPTPVRFIRENSLISKIIEKYIGEYGENHEN